MTTDLAERAVRQLTNAAGLLTLLSNGVPIPNLQEQATEMLNNIGDVIADALEVSAATPDTTLSRRADLARRVLAEVRLPTFANDDAAIEALHYVDRNATPAIQRASIGAALYFLRKAGHL